MKLLIDQNLSDKLVHKLVPYFPNSTHVKSEHLHQVDDRQIWKYAKDGGYCIVSQDADFYELSVILGVPPKVIWIKTGNTSTLNILRLLTENHEAILAFNTDVKRSCMELY